VLVVTALAESAAELRIVRVESHVHEVTSLVRVVVGHSGTGCQAEDAHRVAR
jgi:hypothetical protein